MKSRIFRVTLLASLVLAGSPIAFAGQAPGLASSPDIPVSHHDRVYAAEQFSNTVSVTDPVDNKLLGVMAIHSPAISARSIVVRFWCTAWAFRRTTRPSQSFPSAPIR
jgi:hypothetical protein